MLQMRRRLVLCTALTTVGGPLALAQTAFPGYTGGGIYNTSLPSLPAGGFSPLQLDVNGNLKVNIVSGGGSGGTSSTFGSTFPSTGTAIGGYNGGSMVYLGADGSHNLDVNLQTPLPGGGNTIGAVAQSGTWNVGQTGTWSLTGTVSLPTGASTSALQSAVTGSASGGTAGTSSRLIGGVYNTTPPTVTNGQQVALQTDTSGNLKVNIAAGGAASGGTSSNFGSATPSAGTAIGAIYSGNMVYVGADASHNLDVNCVVGCTAGSTSNAGSAVATGSTNTPTVAYNYAFNGSTWDQLQDDGSKNLKTVVSAALPTGANVIGGVTQSGTWGVNVSTLPGSGPVSPGTAAANSLLTGLQYNSTQPVPTSTNQVAAQADGHSNLRESRGPLTKVPPDVGVVTTGGTAVNAFAAGHVLSGGYIVNPSGAAGPLCINEVATASGTVTSGALVCIPANTTYMIQPGTSAVSVVAADSSHVFGGLGYY